MLCVLCPRGMFRMSNEKAAEQRRLPRNAIRPSSKSTAAAQQQQQRRQQQYCWSLANFKLDATSPQDAKASLARRYKSTHGGLCAPEAMVDGYGCALCSLACCWLGCRVRAASALGRRCSCCNQNLRLTSRVTHGVRRLRFGATLQLL